MSEYVSAYQDIDYYLMVVCPYERWVYNTLTSRAFTYIRGITYEYLMEKYCDYKEGIDDARAQADRWRYQ